MAAPTGSQRLGTASVWQDQTAASSLQCKWHSRTYLVLYKFIDCGFLISKWQGTASSWQGLGPARLTVGYATECCLLSDGYDRFSSHPMSSLCSKIIYSFIINIIVIN